MVNYHDIGDVLPGAAGASRYCMKRLADGDVHNHVQGGPGVALYVNRIQMGK